MKDPKQYPEQAERAFTFRLARDLHMTVTELEHKLSLREFTEWAAYYAAEAKEQATAEKKQSRGRRGR